MHYISNLIAVVVLCGVYRNINGAVITNPNWWKHAVFYQIYPRSFKDSNNDGIGDIQGIISKLDHLKDAGVTAAWLSPIYDSPQVDQGYDIRDFRKIGAEYGTMEDFESLIAEAHKRGIKIIMDFVPNHTSEEHEWFVKSENGTEGYEDFYVWRNGSQEVPPNNWLSVFKYSAWKYSESRKQCYLHQFAEAQPDLNFRSTKVVAELKDVLIFWLDKGVDGFRMDAVPFIFEEKEFKDEPLSNIPGATNETHGYLKHIYTQDQPETFETIYDWRQLIEEYNMEKGGDPRIMMTEAYTDILTIMKYYGNEERDGAHFTFNFFLITDLRGTFNARVVASAVEKWLSNMPKRYVANWVVGNHDNNRIATKCGPKNVDAFNMLVALLPGIMVTYNGEEIGQEDGEVTWEEGQDPNACNGPKEDFAAVTRDVERTPFQWDNSTNAGFNTGFKPWLPVSYKYNVTNLAAQQDSVQPSHYQIYKELIKLRQEDTFRNGDVQVKAMSDDVMVFSRRIENGSQYLVILNLGSRNTTVRVDEEPFSTTKYLEVVISSVASTRRKGDLVDGADVFLQENESLVVVATSEVPSTTTDPSEETDSTTPNCGIAHTTVFTVSILAFIFVRVLS